MAATKDRALDAAVELLGTEGVRALSHARVDAAAGLPAGSTSNWFRTRRALIAGIVDRIAEQERIDFLPPADQGTVERDGFSFAELVAGPDALVDGLFAMVEMQTGPFAVRTRARYALFVELAFDPQLGAPLRRQRLEFERWTEQLVAAAGIPDPVSATRALMAVGDGLMLHRLTVDPAIDMRAVLERTVRGLWASQ